MKTKLYLIGIITLLIGGCAATGHLPTSDKIDVFEYGSFITIAHKKSDQKLRGELIALDSNTMVVLSSETRKCVSIPVSEVRKFSLRYASPKSYGWTIPALSLLSLSHGYWSVFTIPINLIVTIAVETESRKSFRYDNENMTYEDLKMFARFPQGIPPGIALDSIK
jgi:hypothetical protein